jgi:gamma-glutamylcyclotransferase (GGCT)/AIG2-like uncharacterized protein YtfP
LEEPVRYFAYGSNMSAAVISAVSPAHRFLGAAQLRGHRLAFTRRSIRTGSGVADMVADPVAEIWGALYELPHEEVEGLDRKEGVGFAYERRAVLVHTADGQALEAFAYTVAAKEPLEVSPSPDYLGAIIAAGRERGLPEPYLRSLRALLERWHGQPSPSRR